MPKADLRPRERSEVDGSFHHKRFLEIWKPLHSVTQCLVFALYVTQTAFREWGPRTER